MNIKNKKGVSFSLLLVIVTLVLMSYSLYLFASAKDKVNPGLRSPTEIINFNNKIDREQIYENEKIKVAAIQAFYEVAKQGAIIPNENCAFTGDYIIFDSDCEPDEDQIAQLFIEKLEDNENVEEYTFFLEEGNTKLSAIREPLEKKIGLKKVFATYNFEYVLDTSFSFYLAEQGLDLKDFVKAYRKAKGENIEIKWDIEYEENSYKLFKFETKQDYFYQKQEGLVFAPIQFNFAIE